MKNSEYKKGRKDFKSLDSKNKFYKSVYGNHCHLYYTNYDTLILNNEIDTIHKGINSHMLKTYKDSYKEKYSKSSKYGNYNKDIRKNKMTNKKLMTKIKKHYGL